MNWKVKLRDWGRRLSDAMSFIMLAALLGILFAQHARADAPGRDPVVLGEIWRNAFTAPAGPSVAVAPEQKIEIAAADAAPAAPAASTPAVDKDAEFLQKTQAAIESWIKADSAKQAVSPMAVRSPYAWGRERMMQRDLAAKFSIEAAELRAMKPSKELARSLGLTEEDAKRLSVADVIQRKFLDHGAKDAGVENTEKGWRNVKKPFISVLAGPIIVKEKPADGVAFTELPNGFYFLDETAKAEAVAAPIPAERAAPLESGKAVAVPTKDVWTVPFFYVTVVFAVALLLLGALYFGARRELAKLRAEHDERGLKSTPAAQPAETKISCATMEHPCGDEHTASGPSPQPAAPPKYML